MTVDTLAVLVLPLLLAGAPEGDAMSKEEAGARRVAGELRAAILKGDAGPLKGLIPPQGWVATETAISRSDLLKDLERGGFVHAIYFDTAALRRMQRDPSDLLSWREWFSKFPDAEMKVTRHGRGRYTVWFDNGSHALTAPRFELEDGADGRWWIVRHPAVP